jgi:hypothetical protein
MSESTDRFVSIGSFQKQLQYSAQVRLLSLALCGMAALGVAARAEPQSAPPSAPVPLDIALERTAAYIDLFVERFGNVVSEERYRQEAVPSIRASQLGGRGGMASVPPTQRRTLRSDFLLVKPADSLDWFPFRDVYEVDGSVIRDREGRLAKLFLKQAVGALDQARQIAQESSRYNIGDVVRTINNPVIALAFLERSYQKRFAFTMGKADPSIGPTAWILEYKEQQRPTLIRGYGDGDLITRGRAWIDITTGAVLKTEFLIDDALISARVTTTFKPDQRLQINVPAEMEEDYKPSSGGHISGKATYGRFRQFAVKTEEDIQKPELPKPK